MVAAEDVIRVSMLAVLRRPLEEWLTGNGLELVAAPDGLPGDFIVVPSVRAEQRMEELYNSLAPGEERLIWVAGERWRVSRPNDPEESVEMGRG